MQEDAGLLPKTLSYYSTNNSTHRDHGPEAHGSIHHGVCEQEVSYSVTHGNEGIGELLKASLALASGNFSTMQLIFSISVN